MYKGQRRKILSSGVWIIDVLSIGAFADKALYDKIKETATEHDTKYILLPGRWAFDVLRTVS